jgi:hypothetical protein
MVIIAEPQVALVQAAGAAGLVGVAGAAGLAGAGLADVCVIAELPQPLKAIMETQAAAEKHRRMITQELFVRCGWRMGLSFLICVAADVCARPVRPGYLLSSRQPWRGCGESTVQSSAAPRPRFCSGCYAGLI